MLDKRRIRTAFEKAAPGFDDADFLHTNIRNRLLSRLGVVQIQADQILDLGAGTGAASSGLTERFPGARIIALDFSERMLATGRQQNQAGYSVNAVCADGGRLPVTDASIDVIFSNLMLHHCPHAESVLMEAQRVLRFPGLLMLTTFGPDSFIELRKAWGESDARSHVFEFTDMHHIGDALVRAGFAEPVIDSETLTITYDSVSGLMTDLRSVGSVNATDARNPGLTGRKSWQRMTESYEQYRDAAGRLPVTLEIVYALGWRSQDGARVIPNTGDIEIAVENLRPPS